MTTTTLRGVRLADHDAPCDLRIDDGTITAITPAGSAPPAGDAVDADGRWLMPGLWDAHVHFTQWVTRRSRVDLAGTDSARAAAAAMRDALEYRTDDILVGYGFRDALWPDAPTRRALDDIAPDRPLVLISGDLHCGWMNTRALRLLGIDHLPDDGMLRETEWIGALSRLDGDRLPDTAAYREAADAAASRGVVGIVEFENADNVADWPARVAAGVDALRVETSVWPDRLDHAIAQGLRTGTQLEPTGLVTMGRLKIVVDGSLNTRTAYCWDPYPDTPVGDPHRCGLLSVPPDQVDELLIRARDAGLHPAVHAIGDRANTAVIDAFERHRIAGTIEHAQLVARTDLQRFGRLGLTASVQPEHAMDDRDVADRHWAGRTDRAFAFASLHAGGATLTLGSDAPVSPLDPWHAIAAATTRRRDGRDAWHPDERISPALAVSASTRGTTIRVGAPADLVLVETDPVTTDPDALRTMPVALTLLGGRTTWTTL
jgi:predicted amidohydrolase YtcJ